MALKVFWSCLRSPMTIHWRQWRWDMRFAVELPDLTAANMYECSAGTWMLVPDKGDWWTRIARGRRTLAKPQRAVHVTSALKCGKRQSHKKSRKLPPGPRGQAKNKEQSQWFCRTAPNLTAGVEPCQRNCPSFEPCPLRPIALRRHANKRSGSIPRAIFGSEAPRRLVHFACGYGERG